MKRPDPKDDFYRIKNLIQTRKPFSFVRFSDGELEIIRNRKLSILSGKTEFRGQSFKNNFPKLDEKTFDPAKNFLIREDLIKSAIFRQSNYLKGIPTKHNNSIEDRNFMVRLNRGFDNNLTFSDLLMNSNYLRFRREILSILKAHPDVILIVNESFKSSSAFQNADVIKIPTNFFVKYIETKNFILNKLSEIKKPHLIISSASSMSNVIGCEVIKNNYPHQFIDIGTAINDILGFPMFTREYHNLISSNPIKKIQASISKGYKIKW